MFPFEFLRPPPLQNLSTMQTQNTKEKEGASSEDESSKYRGTHQGNCLGIKYSSDQVSPSKSTASCSNTIAMDVCNNFHLPHHLPHTIHTPFRTITSSHQHNNLYYRNHPLLESLSEHQDLHLIVDGQDTGTGDTTENVGSSTLEEGLGTLLGNDLTESIEGRLVLDSLTRSHHHTTTDSIQWVRSNTSTSGNTPSKKEGGKEVALKRTDKDDRLDRVVHTEVQTTVNNDTSDGRTETTVQTSDTISGEGLLVHIDQTVELTSTTGLGVLVVVGETSTGVIEGVDEEEGGSTGHLRKLGFCNCSEE
jgi:hypothetical protein